MSYWMLSFAPHRTRFLHIICVGAGLLALVAPASRASWRTITRRFFSLNTEAPLR